MPAHALTIGLLFCAQYTKSCIFLTVKNYGYCVSIGFCWPNELLTKRDVQVSINLSIHLPWSKPLKSNAQLRPCLISAVRNLRKFFSLVLTLRGKNPISKPTSLWDRPHPHLSSTSTSIFSPPGA